MEQQSAISPVENTTQTNALAPAQPTVDANAAVKAAINAIKKEIEEFIEEFQTGAAERKISLSKGDADTIASLKRLIENPVKHSNALETYEWFVKKLKLIQSLEHFNDVQQQRKVLVQRHGFFKGDYTEEVVENFTAQVAYTPVIKNPLSILIGSLFTTMTQLFAKADEEEKRKTTEQQAPKPDNTELERVRREADEAAKKASALEEKIKAEQTARQAAEDAREAAKETRRREREAREDQRRTEEAAKKEERRKQKEQDEVDREFQREARMKQVVSQAVQTTMVQVGGEFLRVLDVLPQNFRGIAMSAAGQDSLLLTGVSSNTSQHQDQPAIEPKKDLSTKLSLVYNAAQGTNLQLSDEAKIMRIKIRYLQLLLKLRPRDLPIGIIIQKARTLFNALDVALVKDDLVDGHLADFERSVENPENTCLSTDEQEQFCAFAEQSDLGFNDADKVYFKKFDRNSVAALEDAEKKCRFQLIRKLGDYKIKEWLGAAKAPVIDALRDLYVSHAALYTAADATSAVKIEQIAIKFLISQLVLHKDSKTVQAILAKVARILEEKGVVLEELNARLEPFKDLADPITGQALTPAAFEIFECLFSSSKDFPFFRSDAQAYKVFHGRNAGEYTEGHYEKEFTVQVGKLNPQAPRANGLHIHKAATASVEVTPKPGSTLDESADSAQRSTVNAPNSNMK
ncbi:MAG TPA: hypothetical protein VGV92_09555 [Gammaproteobacteria bacterium]|nr:hypothetical protein [Gammaproteobacteria bacterium]